MDVLTAAWTGSGAPSAIAPGLGRQGRCARCGQTATLTPTTAAVSKTFTGYDGWRDVTGRGLCLVCSWGYTTPSLRLLPHKVTREPASLTQLSAAQAATWLLNGALTPGDALVVPLRPGRKHLMPSASWGRVTVDDAPLTWTTTDAELLHEILMLRRCGFGSRMLREPAPPFAVLSLLPAHRWSTVLQAWRRLTVWRSPDNPWLDLALHVTTTPEEIL